MYSNKRTFSLNCFFLTIAGLSLLLGSAIAVADNDLSGTANPANVLKQYNEAFPQQKAYLHTDKTSYLAGETIWLKAYLADAASHHPDTLSTILYVELTSQEGDLLSLLLLRLKEGVAHGDITIPDSLPEGNYRFRVYTDWMKNFNSNFYFTKDIFIHNPDEANYIRRRELRKNRRFNNKVEAAQQERQFAFFPEGGHLVTGLENRVAFKAADGLGAGVEVKGTLRDQYGKEVTTFNTVHDGMGSFAFIPEKGLQYKTEIRFPNGDQKQFELPTHRKDAYLLAVNQEGNKIHIRVNSNNEGLENHLFLLAHTRGKIIHSEDLLLNEGASLVSLPVNDFPDGICHVSLFSKKGTPVAERLFFVNNYSFKNIRLADIEEAKGADGKTTVELQLDSAVFDSGGSYSLAVLDQPTADLESGMNIATGLLLTNDLMNKVKDPWFYLNPNNKKASEAADLLMMTHFWRRFEWDLLHSGDVPELQFGFPNGIGLSGQVTPRSSARETGEVRVELIIEHEGTNMFSTTTDSKGFFTFHGLDYTGKFKALLRVVQGVDKRSLYLELTSGSFNIEGYSKNFNTQLLSITERGDNWERTRRPETPITARRSFAPSARSATMYGDVDQVIYFDDIRDQYHRVIDVLETRVRGLSIEGGRILLRGPSSIIFNNEPLFLVDEQVVTRGQFLNTNIREIDRLTVISGPQAAIFGSRGSNGALLIYTRRGDRHSYESFEYLLQGFHQPAETFESKIFTEGHQALEVSRTIHWQPKVESDDGKTIRLQLPANESGRHTILYIEGLNKKGVITYSAFPVYIPTKN